MAHKKKHHAPVPHDNQPSAGPATDPLENDASHAHDRGAAFEEQDPKRRLGSYQTAGEHALQQPGGKNDANHDR